MDKLNKYKPLVLGIFAVLAPIVAYLFQVDPLSLCSSSLPNKNLENKPQVSGGGSVTTQLDAGVDVK